MFGTTLFTCAATTVVSRVARLLFWVQSNNALHRNSNLALRDYCNCSHSYYQSTHRSCLHNACTTIDTPEAAVQYELDYALIIIVIYHRRRNRRGRRPCSPRFYNFSIVIRFLPYKSTLLSLCATPDLSTFIPSCIYQ